MMFDWLAERHNDGTASEAAQRIERGAQDVLAAGPTRTADLGGRATTSQLAEAVVAAL